MAVTTTGSTVQGTVKGMAHHLNLSGNSVAETITFITGDPDGVVTSTTGSDVAYDGANGQYYMSQGANGSAWIKLGSVS